MPHSCRRVSAAWDCASLQAETDFYDVFAKEGQTQLYLPRKSMQLKGEWNQGSGEKKDKFRGSMHRLVHMCELSHVWLFATPWTAACQTPLSMEFSRQDYCSGLPFPPPGDLPNLGIKPASPPSALAGRFLELEEPVLHLSYSLETLLSLEVCPNIKTFSTSEKKNL